MSGDGILVLVVDDDARIREVVRFALERAGFSVVEAGDGVAGLEVFERRQPGLVILDVAMPEMDGTQVCRRIRRVSDVPILFLSSRDEEIDRVVGLELGADDYVAKPFSPRELVARVRAILRRAGASAGSRSDTGALVSDGGAPVADGPAQGFSQNERPQNTPGSNQLVHGKLTLDLDLFRAYWQEREVVLTRREFALLRVLMGYPGKVYSRDALMQAAYQDGTIVSDRTIDSHIRRVRRKFEELGAQPVETVHGLGYRLGACQ